MFTQPLDPDSTLELLVAVGCAQGSAFAVLPAAGCDQESAFALVGAGGGAPFLAVSFRVSSCWVAVVLLLVSKSGPAIQDELSEIVKGLFAHDAVAEGGFWYALNAVGALSLGFDPPDELPVMP